MWRRKFNNTELIAEVRLAPSIDKQKPCELRFQGFFIGGVLPSNFFVEPPKVGCIKLILTEVNKVYRQYLSPQIR